MSPIHQQAALGFGPAGADYEHGRPGYPEEAVTAMAQELTIAPGRVVVDLAAGTGKLTRALMRFGPRLVAVEPVPGMREQLVTSVPGVQTLNGTSRSRPPTGALTPSSSPRPSIGSTPPTPRPRSIAC